MNEGETNFYCSECSSRFKYVYPWISTAEKGLEKIKGRFKDELKVLNISSQMIYSLLTFFDKISSLSHEFTTELCPSSNYYPRSFVGWSPNEVMDLFCLIQDWSGRVVPVTSFQQTFVPNLANINAYDAPLLVITDNDDDRNNFILSQPSSQFVLMTRLLEMISTLPRMKP